MVWGMSTRAITRLILYIGMATLPYGLVYAEETELVWGCVMEYRDGSEEETERCGLGSYQTLCMSENECVTFFEITEEEQASASNVLFLPGIKGSRLYDSAGNKLWEPFGNHDVEALMLDASGKSLDPDIRTKPRDVVDTVAGFTDIYGSFMQFMDGLTEDDIINDWLALPYDWRLSLPDIVASVLEPEVFIPLSEDPYSRTVLDELAGTSKTGKVTIVAHSNGGLVAKELMRTLGDAETARLIDDVIFVGVPQSGAPQALGALLYGYKEGLPWWFPGIVSTATARSFAENAPMGYHLLPSETYFRDTEDILVSFDAKQAYAEERAAYGATLDSAGELRAFALAKDGGREKPPSLNYADADVLNASLLSYTESLHADIDAWTPPLSIDVHQIAGWGEDTVSGIEYYEQCLLSFCRERYRPTFIEDGDGVVPTASALMMHETEGVNRYWLNLHDINDKTFDRNHGTLLTVNDLQLTIKDILTGVEDPLREHVTESRPSKSDRKSFRFFLHSPLTLDLYDKNGAHVGDGSEEIPGAEYGQFGDVQYLLAPAGPEYDLELIGFDTGTFSLDIQELEGGAIVASTTFVDLPVTAETVGALKVHEDLQSSGPLIVDVDGDGAADLSLPIEAVQEESIRESPTNNRRRISSSAVSVEYRSLQLYLALLQLLLEYLQAQIAHSASLARPI